MRSDISPLRLHVLLAGQRGGAARPTAVLARGAVPLAGAAARPFTLGEETGLYHGHGYVHRTRMLICMHIWGSSLRLSTLFMLFMQLARLTLRYP